MQLAPDEDVPGPKVSLLFCCNRNFYLRVKILVKTKIVGDRI
jgi:hypothetical protein